MLKRKEHRPLVVLFNNRQASVQLHDQIARLATKSTEIPLVSHRGSDFVLPSE